MDEISLKRYENYPEVMKNIKDGSYILQGKEERCPFLRDDLLCRMIIEHGEEFICDICKDHPRFRNYYEDRIEMGLGLCCEEACNIIIDSEEEFALEPETELSDAIKTMIARGNDIMERFESITKVILNDNDRYDIYQEMEHLDDEWSVLLDKIKHVNKGEVISFIKKHAIAMEQLAVYYLYRYPRIPSFSYEACYIIACGSLVFGGSMDDIKEVARMYSSEVEYSNENMDIIYDLFDEDIDD